MFDPSDPLRLWIIQLGLFILHDYDMSRLTCSLRGHHSYITTARTGTGQDQAAESHI